MKGFYPRRERVAQEAMPIIEVEFKGRQRYKENIYMRG